MTSMKDISRAGSALNLVSPAKRTFETAADHSLEIRDFEMQVRLGCSENERAVPQLVKVSLKIDFSFQAEMAPKGFFTDRLDETVCYAKICETLKHRTADREYHLIEFLAHDLVRGLTESLLSDLSFTLKVHKISPPIEGLKGGVIYSCRWDPLMGNA